MPFSVDLNCDLGEGAGSDARIMPFISSANIACGYHAGDAATIAQTIELCLQNDVAIGAHPGFADKENFGRNEIQLPTTDAWYELIAAQLSIMDKAVKERGATMRHVKPHGALYNLSARIEAVASIIAKAVYDFDPKLLLFGLAGSYSITEAKKAGLQTVDEFFADRTYQPTGALTPRSQANALIENEADALKQAIQIAKNGKVVAVDGMVIFPAGTDARVSICLHGDGAHAPVFAERIYHSFISEDIIIKAF